MRVSHYDDGTRCPSPPDIERPWVQPQCTNSGTFDADFNTVDYFRAHLKTLDDPVVFREYMLSKKKYFDMISILPTVIISYISIATRLNWSKFSIDGPFFLVSDLLMFAGTIPFVFFLVSHCIIYYSRNGRCDRLPYRISEYILLSSFGGRIEDILCIFTTLCAGFSLLAKVFKGQCEDNTNIWESQR